MTELILLLALWPFHHKKTDHIAGALDFRLIECDKQDSLYFYMGEDKTIGISPASCEAAIHNWTTLHIDPVRMSRS